MKTFILAAAVTVVQIGTATSVGAQVGYEPSRSPYRDLEKPHEVSIVSGVYRARLDAADVAPRSGPLLGLRYQWRAGGPANLTADISRVASERRVLDPERPGKCVPATPDCQLVALFRWPLYFADVGVALNLTGARSFYHLVPEVRGALGLATDFHTKADVGGFGFGTRFSPSWGAGVRWLPPGPFQLRADVGHRMYSVRYPGAYYEPSPDSTRIRPPRSKRSAWLHNASLTIGLSYLFGR